MILPARRLRNADKGPQQSSWPGANANRSSLIAGAVCNRADGCVLRGGAAHSTQHAAQN